MRRLYRRTGSGFQAKPETHIRNNGLRLWQGGEWCGAGLSRRRAKNFRRPAADFLVDAVPFALNL
jgi:hypothetical protein